ncbi:MAG: bifunctional riboflavin kinase/FAD synthetase [Desulfohalobiaceae bacterium]|nr:bifunctional riboflavin kinase/FAD synthetase [Desulfohalobiaceae bacterium]
MNIFETVHELTPLLENGSCVTIGNFDGVHLGHQTLLQRTREKGLQANLPSVVITFDPHPLRVILGQTPPFITLKKQKLELLARQGLDFVLCLNFTKKTAELAPEEFVKQFLVQGLRMKDLVIGHDYVFGKGGRGNFELLQSLGQEFGFQVHRIDPVLKEGAVVSSTRIRKLIQEGRVLEARPLLGRFYQVTGEVVQGQRRGGPILGVPTANLRLVDELFPKPGVYAVWAERKKQVLPGVANVGYNPTFNHHELSVEVHIFDFDQDLYGQTLKVHFVKRLRDEKKFSGVEELLAQINADIATAREILKDPDLAIPEQEEKNN